MRFRAVTAPLTVALVLAIVAPSTAAPRDAVLTASSTAGVATFVPGELNVKLSGRLLTLPGIDLVPAFAGAVDTELSRWFTATASVGGEDVLASTLSALPGVELVERVPLRVPAYEPNDPRRVEQWHIDRVAATSGWNVQRGNTAVRVGVIDTQFDRGHTELRDVLYTVKGGKGVSEYTDGCSATAPYSEHGTLVAGIAAARTDNGSGVASVGFGIGVVAAQAGTEVGGICAISGRWTRALKDMADAGVPVVNLSFASPRTSALEHDAIRYATNKGTLIVAAAGNDATTTPYYPAADPLVLGVAATDESDRRWARSNHGDWVDIAAPGVSLLTLCPGGYCYASGTSTAAPVVAAIATLLATQDAGLEGLALRNRLLDAADQVGSRVIDPALGYGRVRADRTLTNDTVRLYGRDRIATAQAIAREAYPAGTGERVVSRVVLVPANTPGETGWTVTLPAAGLLADDDTAFVMTGREALHPAAAAEIDRLLAKGGRIVLPGTTTTGVGAAVERQLGDEGYTVTRLGEATAAGTAARLANAILDGSGASAALVSRADTFADALSLSGPAAAKGYPLLFVETDRVPAATCDLIAKRTSLETLYLAGGTNAISTKVERELAACAKGLLPRSITVTRDAGRSRVETAVAIAKRHFGATAPATVSVANGYSWPDAVTGGTLAASHGAPVLTTGGTGSLEPVVKDYLSRGRTTSAFVLGGPVVVSDAVKADVARHVR